MTSIDTQHSRITRLFFAFIFFLGIVLAPNFFSQSLVFAQGTPQAVPGIFPHALLYVTNSKAAMQSLKANINSMDIIVPQIYEAKEDGTLLGEPSAHVLKTAYNAGAQVMPLIINQDFCQMCMHRFLLDPEAQDRLITSLIEESKEKEYLGFQYDFEHMMDTDRDNYTAFVKKSATLFHSAGLQFSVAVAPKHSDDKEDYGKGSWENWTGVFDYHAIGAIADFVTIMAYDDSRSAGPVASIPFVESVLDYTLDRIPAEKVSLGIPTYAWIWRDKTGTIDRKRGYPAIAEVLKAKKYLKKGWSDEFGVSYVTYYRDSKKFTAWYEDQKSFNLKMNLVTKNKLYGYSVWALGLEDPKIWHTMLAMRAPRDGLAMKAN